MILKLLREHEETFISIVRVALEASQTHSEKTFFGYKSQV